MSFPLVVLLSQHPISAFYRIKAKDIRQFGGGGATAEVALVVVEAYSNFYSTHV